MPFGVVPQAALIELGGTEPGLPGLMEVDSAALDTACGYSWLGHAYAGRSAGLGMCWSCVRLPGVAALGPFLFRAAIV